MKRWTINVPIFNRLIIVIQAKNLQTIEEYLRLSEGYDTECSNVRNLDAAVYTMKDGTIVIGLRDESPMTTVLHECAHAVFRIQDQLDSHDEEMFCYLLEWLYEKVSNSVKND